MHRKRSGYRTVLQPRRAYYCGALHGTIQTVLPPVRTRLTKAKDLRNSERDCSGDEQNRNDCRCVARLTTSRFTILRK